jgi:hypothetical protein
MKGTRNLHLLPYTARSLPGQALRRLPASPANDSVLKAKTLMPPTLPRTPRSVAIAVRELSAWGRVAEASAVARSSLFPWAAEGEHDLLREALALLAHAELPPDVVAAVAAVAFTVRTEVLGAEWWVRRANITEPAG